MNHTKTSIIVTVASLILFIFSIVTSVPHVDAHKVRCDSFPSKAAAQEAYDKDPQTYAKLDGSDKDGNVCETTNYNQE